MKKLLALFLMLFKSVKPESENWGGHYDYSEDHSYCEYDYADLDYFEHRERYYF